MSIINKIKENYILVTILVVALLFRFYGADFQSVWLDEVHTLNEANPALSWIEFYTSLLNSEPHPPLYFALMRILFTVFGYTTMVLRLFSAVIGIVSLYGMYMLGKEMHNKKIGLIATFLLSVNYYHLYYSQEGRPYILLVLFTILAFYRLILYIKNPDRKNTILYGIFAALMVYGHFFGLFALFAQYVILLFFFLLTKKEEKLKFFVNLAIAGVITLVLYIPAIPLFIAATKIRDFWIPAPTLDAFTIIFKDFFGNSEIILALVSILIFFYFLRLSKERDFPITYEKLTQKRTIFNFVILALWIVIVLLIPLIRSYISVPMLINRYFIVLLPAIILMISFGLNQFKNKIVMSTILLFFFVFFVTDVVVLKKIFKDPLKSQFREATNFIIKNNKEHHPVVTSLSWYMPYFIKNKKVNYEIIDKSLENYITEMQQDSTKIIPFWYFDAHGRPYKLSEAAQNFVDNNFYIDNNFDGMDAWTKHFILLKNMAKTVDISKYKEINDANGDPIRFYVDTFENTDNIVNASGWAYFDQQESINTNIDIILIKERQAFKLQTQKVVRQDVTDAVKSGLDLNNCGFNSKLNIADLKPGKYRLAIRLYDSKTKKDGLVLTDKIVEKNQ
jgi:mannosyltransferase